MSIYDVDIANLDGEPTNLAPYKGKALLLVNVASQCGLTPQYAGLQRLHETYGAKGFEVLRVEACLRSHSVLSPFCDFTAEPESGNSCRATLLASTIRRRA